MARLARWSAKWFKWRTILAGVSYMIWQRVAQASTARLTIAQSSLSSFKTSSMFWRREQRDWTMITMRKKRRGKTSQNGIARIWLSAIGSRVQATTSLLRTKAMPFSVSPKAKISRSLATSLSTKWTTQASMIASRRYHLPKSQQSSQKQIASALLCASQPRWTIRWSRKSCKELKPS